ncbi:MAG: DUF6165 family protein [Acidiferrobacterales bacterium]
MSQVSLPVSIGEFVDKITILEIKSKRIRDIEKRKNINKELDLLRGIWNSSPYATTDISNEWAQLKSVNESLWSIEDQIRLREAQGRFDETFVELARAVYIKNDERSAIKRRINILLESDIVEEKSYTDRTREKL